jgi:hypothetical protein
MGQIIVDNGQAKVVVVRHGGIPGSIGPTGSPGTAAAASSTFAGLGTPTAGEVRRVTDNVRGLWYANGSDWISVVAERLNPKAFGAKGDNSTDDTTAIQAMATLLAASPSRVSEVEWPPGIYKISAPIDWGFTSGKIIQGAGANPYDNPALSGTRIVQTADDVPIFSFGSGGLFPRAVRFADMSLAYETQQTSAETAALGMQIVGSATGTPHDLNFENFTVEKAYDSIGCTTASALGVWNLYGKNIRLLDQAHSALWFPNTAGSPMNRLENIFIANTSSGVVPTGPAVKHLTGGLTIDGLDIEGWNNAVVEFSSGWYYAINNLHIEWHTFSGADPYLFDVGEVGLRIREALIAAHPTTPGSFTGNANLFRVWTDGAIDVDNLIMHFPAALAGTVLFMDGPGLDGKSRVGANIRNTGAKAIPILDGSFSIWGTENEIRQDNTTAWVTPSLGAGWTTIPGYQAPRYRRKGDIVEVEGLVQNTSGGALSTDIFTLPAGFRPTAIHVNAGYSAVNTTPIVAATGAVSPPAAIPDDGFLPVQMIFSVL